MVDKAQWKVISLFFLFFFIYFVCVHICVRVGHQYLVPVPDIFLIFASLNMCALRINFDSVIQENH